jgi:RNA polymerase sigma factor (sigma-70 family)
LSESGSPALTEDQRRFAAENHNLIYRYLYEQGRAVDDYYDIAALGFLSAVRRYMTKPELRRYAFSTIAWRSMKQSIASFHRAETRREAAERRYKETVQVTAPDPMSELEARLILHDLVSTASRPQYEMMTLRSQGYSIAETARSLGIEPRRVRSLLRELYRVYLKLYMN